MRNFFNKLSDNQSFSLRKIKILSRIKYFFLFLCILQLLSVTSFAQTSITGTVLDETGEGLVGVNVKLKNSNTVTSTGKNGSFSIIAPNSMDILVFSYIGYGTVEESLNGRKTINVKLPIETGTLADVVMVGYGTLNKKEVTSTIVHVAAKDLLSVGGNNPLMSLQGKVAGLVIDNSRAADPNSNPSIQLRGVSSRSAGLGPLIIIDGVLGGNLENLNQNDIASIDVLKDGAASAIYGTRGSNGVIIVTTKKGGGGPKFSYNALSTFDIPSNALKTLTADEYLKNGGNDFAAKTDWLDQISRKNAFSQKHTLSFSGGDARTNYRATVDYRQAQGIEIRSGREEYGARLSLNHKSKNDLYEITFNVVPRSTKFNNADYESFNMALSLNPTQPVFSPTDPSRYFEVQGSDVNAFNPVERLLTDKSGGTSNFLDWNGTFKLNILSNLSTRINVAQVGRNNLNFFFRPSTSTSSKFYGGLNYANQAYTNNVQKTAEWINDYSIKVKKHSFKLLAGYSYQFFQYSALSAENRGFTTDAFTYNNLGNGTYGQQLGVNGMASAKNDSRLIAFFGRFNYSYNDKYLFSTSLRHEGSSKFGAASKWGYFPAASIGWRINRESFLKNISWINDLKIRADYGVTGNQDFDNYLSLALYQGYNFFPYNGTYYQSWGPANNLNENLRWEKARNLNLGVDFSLFNNSISGSINYYKRNQEDLLGYYNVPTPPNINTRTFANVGTMQNSGIELQLSAVIFDKGDFNYSISFAGATNNNKFISFSNNLYRGQNFVDAVSMPAPGSPGPAVRLQEGERVGNFYMYKYAGADNVGNFQIFNKKGDIIPSSQAKEEDKRIVGNGLPKYTMSWGNTFTYKQWDASVFFRGAFGFDIFNVHDFYYGLKGSIKQTNVLASAAGRNSKIYGPGALAFLNSYFIEKGDYIKLDVVTIGYTMASKSKYIESARFFASSRNLLTITNFTGVDPEAYSANGLYPGILTDGNGNGSKAYYPSTRQIIFGLTFNF